MTGQPRAYPLLARLRYAHYEGEEPLHVYENAWWEPRWGGGRLLGSVVDAMNHPRTPYRLSLRLLLNPQHRPTQMEASLLRPDGEGAATYSIQPELVTVEGLWNGIAFSEETLLPEGFTMAPHSLAADGLHFSGQHLLNEESRVWSYLLNPRQLDRPLAGQAVSWKVSFLGDECLSIMDRIVSTRRYRTTYENAPDFPADFWIGEGYPLQMISQRKAVSPLRVTCDRFMRPAEEI